MHISDWSSYVCSADLPGADDGIRPGPAVDGGVGADLDAVADDDAAELRHVDEALGIHREAEAAGADPRAGVDLAGASDLAVGERRVGADHRAVADGDRLADHAVRLQAAAAADLREIGRAHV